jgi:hypothetical protein
VISKKEILIGVGHGCLFAADTIAESRRRKGKLLRRLGGSFLQKGFLLFEDTMASAMAVLDYE